MGRPKKEDTPAPPDLNKKDFGPIKLCPKCGADKPSGPTRDIHGHYRTYCPLCNFWEPVVSMTPEESVKRWNEAGGPAKTW